MLKGRIPTTEVAKDIMRQSGARLATLAALHQLTPTSAERRLGLAHGHYRLIVAGERPISIELGIRICEQFDVTLDWLFRGISSTQDGG
jgi:hypothetical protein